MKTVVIEALGLHLGYLGCYGNDWVATPNLDRLAAEGVVFDWHYVDHPELQPVTAWEQRPLARGLAAAPRVVRCASANRFADEALAAVLAPDPWTWIEGPSLLPPWELDEELLAAYFDEDDAEEKLTPWPNPPLDLVKLTEAETLELQNTYAAIVTYIDAQIGSFIDRLRERGVLDEMLLCVTARSGLPLGEHGMIGTPRPWLHDELVHVPLLMRLPDAAEAGRRVRSLTQPGDLGPTFRGQIAGAGLWPALRGQPGAVRPHAVSTMRLGNREQWLLRTWNWAYHLPVQTETDESAAPRLYAKPDDRWEVNDLCHQEPEQCEELERTLRQAMSSNRSC